MQVQFSAKQAAEFKDGTAGRARVEKHGQTVMVSLAKLMRTSSGFLNARDLAAVEDLLANFELYILNSLPLLDQVNRVCQKKLLQLDKDNEEDQMVLEVKDVSMQVLEESNVSIRQLEQIKLLIAVDQHIFSPENKRHPRHDLMTTTFDHFVDFTRLPPTSELSKAVKSLLYAPDKMKVLAQAYQRLCLAVRSNFARKEKEQFEFDSARSRRA